jgi:hypothetical protein
MFNPVKKIKNLHHIGFQLIEMNDEKFSINYKKNHPE